MASTPSTLDAGTLSKRVRFQERRRALLAGCSWIYFPERDLFQEILTVQPARHSPTGKSRILPTPLAVYGREVFNAPEVIWRKFLEAHPLAVMQLHAQFREAPKDGGIFAPDAFAVQGAGGDAIR